MIIIMIIRCSVLDEPMEESIMDPRIHAETAEDNAPHVVNYQQVEAGMRRPRTKFVNSDGHTYNVHLRRATYWQCTIRGKGNYCKAIVIQWGDGFQQGKEGHNHPPEVGAANAATIMASVKEKAVNDQFKPASAIVNEVSLKKDTLKKILTIFIRIFGIKSDDKLEFSLA